MSTLTARPYRLAGRHQLRGRFGDLLTADVRLMLTTSAYTPADADEWATTPANAEASGAGYTAGGIALPNRTVDNVTAGGVTRAVLGCDPITFTDAGFTARWAVVYLNTGDPATSPLLSYIDLAADVSPAGEDLTLTFTDGVFRAAPATP